MSTTMKSDELNIVRDETVVEKRNVLDIDTFFEEYIHTYLMYTISLTSLSVTNSPKVDGSLITSPL